MTLPIWFYVVFLAVFLTLNWLPLISVFRSSSNFFFHLLGSCLLLPCFKSVVHDNSFVTTLYMHDTIHCLCLGFYPLIFTFYISIAFRWKNSKPEGCKWEENAWNLLAFRIVNIVSTCNDTTKLRLTRFSRSFASPRLFTIVQCKS